MRKAGRRSALPAEVGRYFAPFVGFPFYDAVSVGVGLQPVFGAPYDVEQRVVGVGFGNFGLATPVAHPCNCRAAVGIDCRHSRVVFQQRQGMNNGKKLTYVVARGSNFLWNNCKPE